MGGSNLTAGRHVAYKWIALSNTTLGVLMASINGTILIISLPAIFRGIAVNPLAPSQTSLLLWVLLSFNVATTVLLVTFGRISDTYGRVRLYNLGFAVFTIGSVLASLTPGTGVAGELELIAFRFVQGIGGAFLFANSAAILTDAFPSTELGLALGLNQVAAIGGAVVGLVLGGILSAIDWRAVFLVSVPIGLAGTVWAYVALREQATTRDSTHVDVWGNLTFGFGLLSLLVGLTYGILPYGTSPMGWSNPMVDAALVLGGVLLVAFVFVERRARDPMFHLSLFANRAFAAGNGAGLLASLARGGLQFMVIIWLQGIWLPLHGVPYVQTPLAAGLDTLPQMAGFLIAGPVSGRLSDRYGARWFGFAGMILSACGFGLLTTLGADFPYWAFAIAIFVIGAGMGLFASPNSAAIMGSVPPVYRGVASGMRSTFTNAGMMMSMGLFFTIVIGGLSGRLPAALRSGLSGYGLPHALVAQLAHLPPTAALFAALLGYNPMAQLLPAAVLGHLPASAAQHLLARTFFPNLISTPFMAALRLVFEFALVMSVAAAVMSLLRGRRYVWSEAGEGDAAEPAPPPRPRAEPQPQRGGGGPGSTA
jgi:MFS family permease